jgi:tetratricopeptide (TPR) repeat protein
LALFTQFYGRLFGEGELNLRSQVVDAEGDRLLLEKKLDEATKIYQTLIREDPEKRRLAADRLVEVAYLRRETDLTWSIEALRRAVRLDADHGRGHVILGELLYLTGEKRALFHLHKGAQRLAPGKPAGLPSQTEAALKEVSNRLKGSREVALLRRWKAHLKRRLGDDTGSLREYLALMKQRGWNRPDQY